MLSAPPRPADRQDTFQLREQALRLQAWTGLAQEKAARLGWHASEGGILAPRWNPALETTALAVLDGSDYHPAEVIVSDVPVALCNRAFLTFSQKAPGIEY